MGIATIRCAEKQCNNYASVDPDKESVTLTHWIADQLRAGWLIEYEAWDLYETLHDGPDVDITGHCPTHAVIPDKL